MFSSSHLGLQYLRFNIAFDEVLFGKLDSFLVFIEVSWFPPLSPICFAIRHSGSRGNPAAWASETRGGTEGGSVHRHDAEYLEEGRKYLTEGGKRKSCGSTGLRSLDGDAALLARQGDWVYSGFVHILCSD